MKTYLLLFLISISFSINGQSFQEIQFDNFTPIWTHYTNMEIKNNPIRSYRSKKHILTENKMYVLSNAINSGFTGHALESIDLETGDLLWDYSYYPNLNGKKEYAANLVLKNSSALQLLSVINKDDNSRYWRTGVLGQRYFNIHTGEISDSIFLDGGFRISIPYGIENILSPLESNFEQFQMKSLSIIENYVSIQFSPSGEIIGQTVRQKVGDITEKIKSKSLYSMEDGRKCLMTHYVKNENEEKFHINILALSQTLDTISYFTVKENVDAASNFEIIDATKDYILLKSLKEIYNGTFKYKKYGYYLFDMNGTLLDKVILENTSGDDKFDGGRAIKVNDENKIFCVYSAESNGFQKLVFAKSDGTGNFKTLKEIQSITKDDWFQCKSIDILPSNDIVVDLQHSSRKYSDPYAEKSVWMKVSEQDVYSSVKNLSKSTNFVIYPNPTFGKITIKTSSINPSKIIVFDLLGIPRKELAFRAIIQLTDLPTGIYFIELLDNYNNSLGNQKIILD